jgi:exopolyphosphatase/guanosine-5'-triphosphate,3'-diphosphate pyrophosphatase
MSETLASIDIGTHTARLLVASKSGPQGFLRPLFRKRAYIRLAAGFDYSGKKTIQSSAIDRTLAVLEDFSFSIRKFNPYSVNAVATGVVRQAINRNEFLSRICQRTGIRVRVVTGNEEARLTMKGVLHGLGIKASPFFIFDLGGGSTEFLLGGEGMTAIRSLPLGAVILTQEYLQSDPPEEAEIDKLSSHIDRCLEELNLGGDGGRDQCRIIGTGGTMITLAAMLYSMPDTEIIPERINGSVLKRQQIEALFNKIRALALTERLRLPGLDQGRVDVIVAGSLIVLRILNYIKSLKVVVSMSDLLEGILIDCFEGEENG